MEKIYNLRKSRHILNNVYQWFKKRGNTLPEAASKNLEADLRQLDSAILDRNREKASDMAKKMELFSEKNIKKSIFDYFKELVFALVFALIIATIVRQMWFEPYEIPTGSMRPTFKEQDHLTVSKTAFGINVPLKTEHLYFDPALVKRGGIIIFSGDGIALPDTETTYFYLFPYTKRYIKRLIGKPGDSLYFYGGKIYGIDKQGNPIDLFLTDPHLKNLEHIPFLSFAGDISGGGQQFFFHQMHQMLGRAALSRSNEKKGEIFDGKSFIKDDPNALKTPHDTVKTYSDFLGMKNFGMARLLTKDELANQKDLNLSGLKEAPLYLEISHSPTLSEIYKESSRKITRADHLVSTFKTVIPLNEESIKKIMENMYTARFVVSNQKAARYSNEKTIFNTISPNFPGVEDGTYEFYYGKAYKIGFGGTASLLDKFHPLYSLDPKNVQRLYNTGIELNKRYEPSSENQNQFPNRYVYFNDGDLYLLGGIIFKKDDPVLTEFIQKEKAAEEAATFDKPYIAFKDYGSPLKEGKMDAKQIKAFGITVPEKKYLVLGDNHAMSADSRVFGFVPESNLQGVPSLILWPFGDRWGIPNQEAYPIFVLPRLIIWTIAGLIGLIWYLIHRRNMQKSVFK
ncbi:MAG TPA: signal peptidase I [Parachlamydiaceae bacterium]|nr:signal peptidase I [Parachlamydiaceae bacterium]